MPKKIIVGILDWGLGHATRCIPIIHYLLQTQCQIFIAATGSQRRLLQEEFPDLTFLEPPPYLIHYPPQGKNLVFYMLKQLPRLYKVREAEHKWLKSTIAEFDIDIVLSDNRYGFHTTTRPSVMITHQLAPKSGVGRLMDKLVRRFHFRQLSAFTECWVPDFQENEGLAGDLSHPNKLPKNTSYIGPLSRLRPQNPEKQLDLLVLLSGPEPTRSEFEELLRNQLNDFQGSYLIIRGLPGKDADPRSNEMNYANARQINQYIAGAELIICRSGYTSVMDLVKLDKKAVLVPTPGQTEQEYLAVHLQDKKYFPFIRQDEFDLKKAFTIAQTFNYRHPGADFNAFQSVLERLVKQY